MTYRDDGESLRAYRERVAADLEDARRAAREASERATQVARLEADLADVDAKLNSLGAAMGRGRGPSLEDVRVASPCSASWEDMKGDDRVRFCGKCEKNVYNLSAMPRAEAEALLADRGASMCVRLYKRADGMVMTDDCPVGVRHKRRVRLAVATVGGGLLAAAAAMASRQQQTCMQGTAVIEQPVMQGEITMGSVATPPPPPPTTTPHQVTMGKPSLRTLPPKTSPSPSSPDGRLMLQGEIE
jgi:hypothetical protein